MVLGLVRRGVRLLPLSWALMLGRMLGTVWYVLVPVRRSVARQNVARVFGTSLSVREHKRIVRRSMQQLGMYVIESLRTLELDRARSQTRVVRSHPERFDALARRNRGVIFVTCHLGQFDLAGISHALLGHDISAVVKRIHWAPAEALWTEIRSSKGLHVIGERDSAKEIVTRLRAGASVAMLIDQHLPPHRAIVCRFFGGLAATTPAPVRFAMMTGAAIQPVFMVRDPTATTHTLHYGEELVLEGPYATRAQNVRHNTERLNRIVEAWILAHPEQWWWVHRRWKAETQLERFAERAPLASGATGAVQ